MGFENCMQCNQNIGHLCFPRKFPLAPCQCLPFPVISRSLLSLLSLYISFACSQISFEWNHALCAHLGSFAQHKKQHILSNISKEDDFT